MKTTTLKDPSLDEMTAFLSRQGADEYDAAVAIYWFASQWHGGQWSNLYSALCSCGFEPGPIARLERETESVRGYVCDLEEKFAGVDYGPNPCGIDLKRGPVWMLWHGGSSYTAPDQNSRDDCEEFATLEDAIAEFESRESDSYYPCVSKDSPEDGGPSAWVCFTDPFQQDDVYPDATIQFNARGIATATEA